MKAASAVPLSSWPSGDSWVVAVLVESPLEIATRTGLAFACDQDDLDAYQLCAIDDSAVGQLWLVRYDRARSSGTEVWVDAGIERDGAMKAVKRALGPRTAFEWVNEERNAPIEHPPH